MDDEAADAQVWVVEWLNDLDDRLRRLERLAARRKGGARRMGLRGLPAEVVNLDGWRRGAVGIGVLAPTSDR